MLAKLQHTFHLNFRLTDTILLQPRQSINILSHNRLARDIRLAILAHVPRTEELDGCADQAGEVEGEEDEGERHDGLRDQVLAGHEHGHPDEVDYGQGADGDAVGHDPVGGGVLANQSQLSMDVGERQGAWRSCIKLPCDPASSCLAILHQAALRSCFKVPCDPTFPGET